MPTLLVSTGKSIIIENEARMNRGSVKVSLRLKEAPYSLLRHSMERHPFLWTKSVTTVSYLGSEPYWLSPLVPFKKPHSTKIQAPQSNAAKELTA